MVLLFLFEDVGAEATTYHLWVHQPCPYPIAYPICISVTQQEFNTSHSKADCPILQQSNYIALQRLSTNKKQPEDDSLNGRESIPSHS